MREKSCLCDERMGGPPIVFDVRWSDPIAWAAKIIAAAQHRVFHLLISKPLCAAQPLPADVALALIGRHFDDFWKLPYERGVV